MALAIAEAARASAEGRPDALFAACDRALQQTPPTYETYLCYYSTAAGAGRLEAARDRLGSLIEAHRSPFATLVAAHVEYASGESEAGILLYRRAAEEAERAGLGAASVVARTNLRKLLLASGATEEAGRQVELAYAAARATGDNEALIRASVLEAQHTVDTSRDLGSAVRAFERAELLAFPDGPLGLQTSILFWLGDAYFDLGRLDEAIATYERLRDHKLANGDATQLSVIDFNLINIKLTRLELFPVESAREELLVESRRALERAVERDDQRMLPRLHGNLADLQRRDQPEQARRSVAACRETAARLTDPKPMIHCLWSEALLLRQEQPERALALSREAMAESEAAEALLYLAYAARAHLRVVWHALSTEEAFEESLLALDTVERLRSAQELPVRAELFATWTGDYHYVAGQLLQRGELDRAFATIDRMRVRSLLESMGEGAEHVPPATLHAVQAKLEPDEVMLLWSIGLDTDVYGEEGGGSWLLAVTAEGAEASRIAARDRLAPMVRLAREQLRNDELAPTAAATVRESLFGTTLDLGSARHAVLVRDDVAYLFPIAAVAVNSALDQVAMSSTPSAGFWHRTRELETERPNGTRGLVIADPLIAAMTADLATRDRNISASELRPLPHARREGKRVVRHLAAELWVGEKATETRLRTADLGDIALLHVAAHAFSDGADGERSAVVLAADQENDGLLTTAEIKDLELDGTFVVLSVCEASSGPLLRGEGLFSLSRSFLQAGARAVLATQWRIEDGEARRFIELFYDALTESGRADSALRTAQHRAAEAGLPISVWSGFELFGDGSVTVFAKPVRRIWPALLLAVFAFATALVLRRG